MWVKSDLHLHTIYSSDSTIPPKLLVREAIELELEVIAVTDHNTFQGALEVKRLSKEYSEYLIVLTGIELETTSGELILLTREPLERLPKELHEAVDYARSEEAIILIPHPFDHWKKGIGELVYEVEPHAVEVFNPWASPKANKKALIAAKTLNAAMVASSDAHTSEYIGCAYTLLEVSENSVEEVFNALKNGKTKPRGKYPPMKDRVKSRAKKILKKTGFYREESNFL